MLANHVPFLRCFAAFALGAFRFVAEANAQGPCDLRVLDSSSIFTERNIDLDARHVALAGFGTTRHISTYLRDPQTGDLTFDMQITNPFLGSAVRFGVNVALDAGRLAVASDGGAGVRIYVHGPSGWTLEQELGSIQTPVGEKIGLALWGDLLLVAAVGGVEAWERDGTTGVWQLEHVIPRPAGGTLKFGEDLAFDGRALAVADLWAGRVSVYRRSFSGTFDWLQDIRSALSPHTVGFAAQVEMDDLGLVIAREAHLPDQPLEVHHYVPSTGQWTMVQVIEPPFPQGELNPNQPHYFGTELRLSRGTLVVSAPATATNGPLADDGALFVYKQQQGSKTFRLERTLLAGVPGSPVTGDYLGLALALDDGLLAVSGSALFAPSRFQIFVPGSTDCDQDGNADACEILLGQAFDDNRNGFVDECELSGVRYCSPAVPNSTGATGRMNVFGSTSVLFFNLDLVVSGIPPGALGYVLASRQNQVVTNPGGSLGDLCVAGGAIARGLGGARSAAPDGRISIVYNRPVVPLPGGLEPILPGQTWHFQCWYLDPAMIPRSNFSDAVAVTFTFL
jgi:hypothetical protein